MDWLQKYFQFNDKFPVQASSYADDVDGIFRIIYAMTGVAFVLVMVTLLSFLFLYRSRPGRKAIYHHGNSTLELVWTLIPAAIFIWLAFHSQHLWERLRGPMPPGDVTVGVTGRQFNWFFTYPGRDGMLGKANQKVGPDLKPIDKTTGHFYATEGPEKDNVEIEGVLVVPVDKVIRLSLASEDVIHSLYLPNMRLKQDTVPGRTIEVWFKPTKVGDFPIICAELCGFGHTTMGATLKVLSAGDYAKWLKDHPDYFPKAAP